MNAMLAHNGAFAYKQVNRFSGVENASPHQLIEMLLKGALDKIATSKGYMVRHNWARKGEEITKTIAIVQELKASLNLEAGGSLAERMNNLYEYVTMTLLSANLENNPDKLDEASVLINQIHESWTQIPKELRG